MFFFLPYLNSLSITHILNTNIIIVIIITNTIHHHSNTTIITQSSITSTRIDVT